MRIQNKFQTSRILFLLLANAVLGNSYVKHAKCFLHFSPLSLHMKERIADVFKDMGFQIKMLLAADYSKDAGRPKSCL